MITPRGDEFATIFFFLNSKDESLVKTEYYLKSELFCFLEFRAFKKIALKKNFLNETLAGSKFFV